MIRLTRRATGRLRSSYISDGRPSSCQLALRASGVSRTTPTFVPLHEIGVCLFQAGQVELIRHLLGLALDEWYVAVQDEKGNRLVRVVKVQAFGRSSTSAWHAPDESTDATQN